MMSRPVPGLRSVAWSPPLLSSMPGTAAKVFGLVSTRRSGCLPQHVFLPVVVAERKVKRS